MSYYDVIDAQISHWRAVARVRVVRAVVFFVAALLLLGIVPYDHSTNPFVLSAIIGMLSLISQGTRVSVVALGTLVLLATIPKEIVTGLIG